MLIMQRPLQPIMLKSAGNDPYTKLLLHMNGVDASTLFVDSSRYARPVTAVQQAQIDTAQYRFDGSSGLFDGTLDQLTVPASADWDMAAGVDFGFDFWIRFTGTGQTTPYGQATNNVQFSMFPTTGQVYLNTTGLGTFLNATPGPAFATATWIHMAVERRGRIFTIYRDGRVYASAIASGAWGSNSALQIGGYNAEFLNGWLAEYRVVVGKAPWMGREFAVPSQPYK